MSTYRRSRNGPRRSEDRRIGVGYYHHQPKCARTYNKDRNSILPYYNGYNIPFIYFADKVCRIADLEAFHHYKDFLEFIHDHLYDEAREVATNNYYRDHIDLLDLLDEHFGNPVPRHPFHDNAIRTRTHLNIKVENKDYQNRDPALPHYNGYNIPFEHFAEEVCHLAKARVFRSNEEFLYFVYDHLHDKAKYIARNYLDDNLVSSYDHIKLLDLLHYYFYKFGPPKSCDYHPASYDEFQQGNQYCFHPEAGNKEERRDIAEKHLQMTNIPTAQIMSARDSSNKHDALETNEKIRIELSHKENCDPSQQAEQRVTVQVDQNYITIEDTHNDSIGSQHHGNGYLCDTSAQSVGLSVECEVVNQKLNKKRDKKLVKLKGLLMEFVSQGEISQSQADRYEEKLVQVIDFLSEEEIDEALDEVLNISGSDYSSELEDQSEGNGENDLSTPDGRRSIRIYSLSAGELEEDADEEPMAHI